MTILDMLAEMNSYVSCTRYFKSAANTKMTADKTKRLKELVEEWTNGRYDEDPEILVQELVHLID
jgi:hypothetical protein